MPVMDGLTAIQELRQMEARGEIKGRIPVLAVTANARQEQLETVSVYNLVCLLPTRRRTLIDFCSCGFP